MLSLVSISAPNVVARSWRGDAGLAGCLILDRFESQSSVFLFNATSEICFLRRFAEES